MPQITIHSNVQIVRQGLEKLRAGIPTIGRKRLYDAAEDLMHRMQVPGTKSVYPVHWDSPLQRRAFFASNGFGQGIPTVRSNSYIKGWKVERSDSGYTVKNDQPRAKFIGGLASGAGQSQIHVGRWRLLRDQAELVVKNLPKLVVENLRDFIKKVFVPTDTMGR